MEELSGYNDEEGFLCHVTSVLVHSKYGHVHILNNFYELWSSILLLISNLLEDD